MASSSNPPPPGTPGHLDGLEGRLLAAIDESETLGLLRSLIAVPSENPPGAEAACARQLASFLGRRGIDCRLEEVAPGRPNLYASVGSADGPTLVLCGHLDTVPAGDGWTRDPFSPSLEAGLLYGRGACDMKAGLAATAAALLALHSCGLPRRGRVAIHAVVDEEAASLGAREAAASERCDWVVVAEPSGCRVLPFGNGQASFEIEFEGAAVHSSHPEDGRNAIGDAAALVALVEARCAELSGRPYPGIGPATIGATLIAGGRDASTVPDRCRLTVDRRLLPSESLEEAEAETSGLLRTLAGLRPGLRYEMTRVSAFPPLSGVRSAPLTEALEGALVAAGGSLPAGHAGMRFATDASWYEAAGSAAVVFGPGDIAVAHRPDEHVALSELHLAARALALLAVRLTG